MKKTSDQSKKLTLDRTTIALLCSTWRKRQGANFWNFENQLSSIPPICDITNPTGVA